MVSNRKITITKHDFSGPTFSIISINIEGISQNKNTLTHLCKETLCDLLCQQKIHKDNKMKIPKINGMKLTSSSITLKKKW